MYLGVVVTYVESSKTVESAVLKTSLHEMVAAPATVRKRGSSSSYNLPASCMQVPVDVEVALVSVSAATAVAIHANKIAQTTKWQLNIL